MKTILKIIDFRWQYVMHRLFSFYGKAGVTGDVKHRRKRIDDAVPGVVIKVLSLPFIFAKFWEGITLALTAPFARAPRRAGRDAGRTEWRWFPGITLILIAIVTAEWLLQAWLITYAVTALIGDPIDLRNVLSKSIRIIHSKFYA